MKNVFSGVHVDIGKRHFLLPPNEFIEKTCGPGLSFLMKFGREHRWAKFRKFSAKKGVFWTTEKTPFFAIFFFFFGQIGREVFIGFSRRS